MIFNDFYDAYKLIKNWTAETKQEAFLVECPVELTWL